MKKIVITGGAGFIGSHLVTHFAAEGVRTIAFDNLRTGHRENLDHVQGPAELVLGDVRDRDALAAVMKDADAVLHQAAIVSVPDTCERPLESDEVNTRGTLHVLEAARALGVPRVVFAASAAAYGERPGLPKHEDDPPDPRSPYAAQKLVGEHYCRVYAHLHGVRAVPLRYFNIFGARQDPRGPYAGVISKFVDVMMAGETPTFFGDGTQTRDFCHVSDVVRANVAALSLDLETCGAPINIGTGRQTSLRDLIAALDTIFERETTPMTAPPRLGDVAHSVADVGAAKARLGFVAETDLETGLRELVDSLR